MDPHTAWYIARAGGLVAWALTSAALLWGLALSGRPFGRRVPPAWLFGLHEHLGGLAVLFTVVHVAGLIADSTVPFGVLDVLVPFASDWRPGAVALGVLATWLLIAVQLTSLLRRRLPARLWRAVHRASMPLWLLATAHLLTAGSDARTSAVVLLALGVAAAVAFLGSYRLVSSRRAAPRERAASR